jgi:hypothetical protein
MGSVFFSFVIKYVVLAYHAAVVIFHYILGSLVLGLVLKFFRLKELWLKYFSKNISIVRLGPSLNIFHGDKIHLSIKNNTSRVFNIYALSLQTNESKYPKESLKTHLQINPEEIKEVCVYESSCRIINSFSEFYKNNIVTLFTDKGKVVCSWKKTKGTVNNKSLKDVDIIKITINGKVVSDEVVFYLEITLQDKTKHDALILKDGLINNGIISTLGKIDKKHLSDIHDLSDFLYKSLGVNRYGLIHTVTVFDVKNRRHVTLLINKIP